MTGIAVISALVGLVWAVVALRHGGWLFCFTAILVLGSCFGYEFYHVAVGPLPLTSDRVLIAGSVIILALARWFGLVKTESFSRTDAVVAAFALVLALSVFAHNWRVDDKQPLATFLFFFLMPVALFALVRQIPKASRDIYIMFAVLALFGLYLAVTAIAETRQMWWLIYPKYIASIEHDEFLGRGRGPFLNPVGCGLYLTIALVAGLMFWPRINRAGKLMLIGYSVLILVGAYCTLTRSVWLGIALSLVVVIGLRVPPSWRLPLAVSVTLCGFVLLAANWGRLAAFKRDKYVSAYDMSQSAKLRPILATVAWKMFKDHPIAGCGFGQYKHSDVDYLKDPNVDLPLERARPYVQHNVFLALLTETGLLGAGLYVAILCIWTRNAWLLWRDKVAPLHVRQVGLVVIAYLVAHVTNGMFHDVSIIPMANMLLFMVGGIGLGLDRTETVARQAPRAPTWSPLPLGEF